MKKPFRRIELYTAELKKSKNKNTAAGSSPTVVFFKNWDEQPLGCLNAPERIVWHCGLTRRPLILIRRSSHPKRQWRESNPQLFESAVYAHTAAPPPRYSRIFCAHGFCFSKVGRERFALPKVYTGGFTVRCICLLCCLPVFILFLSHPVELILFCSGTMFSNLTSSVMPSLSAMYANSFREKS